MKKLFIMLSSLILFVKAAVAEQNGLYPLQIDAYRQGMAELTKARDKSYKGETAVLRPEEMKSELNKLNLVLDEATSAAPEEYRLPGPVKDDFQKHVQWLMTFPYSVQEAVIVVHMTEEIRSRFVVLYLTNHSESLSKDLLQLGEIIDRLQSHTVHLAFSADLDSILHNLPDPAAEKSLLKAMDEAAARVQPALH